MTASAPETSSLAPERAQQICRRLRIVQWVALADLLLLAALITSAVTGARDLVHILGPLHGVNFLLLIALVGIGAIDALWGWWFPALVLFTAGPPGAFIGEWIIRHRLAKDSRPKSDGESA